MAELSRIQHVVPAPSVAHDPNRIYRAGDGKGGRPRGQSPREDHLELHDSSEVEAELDAIGDRLETGNTDDTHIDIAV